MRRALGLQDASPRTKGQYQPTPTIATRRSPRHLGATRASAFCSAEFLIKLSTSMSERRENPVEEARRNGRSQGSQRPGAWLGPTCAAARALLVEKYN
jgi:hypothetical protein